MAGVKKNIRKLKDANLICRIILALAKTRAIMARLSAIAADWMA